jgi:hypothetical protein
MPNDFFVRIGHFQFFFLLFTVVSVNYRTTTGVGSGSYTVITNIIAIIVQYQSTILEEVQIEIV